MNGRLRNADPNSKKDVRQALSDPIAQNISDIVDLENQELERMTPAERWLEALSRRFARPAYLVGGLSFVVVWVALNVTGASVGIPRFDPPPFHWLQGLLTLTALLTTMIVLIGQARQSRLAEQRGHLDLQINLFTEQKVTKLIHLIEELRVDLPGVRERHDPHVSQLKEPADPAQLASALKDRYASGDSTGGVEPDE
jgi:uncharacterized membrane protein